MTELLIYVYQTCVITEVSLVSWWVNSEENWDIITISETRKPITTLEGIQIQPDRLVTDITSLDDIAGILFPGGIDIKLSKELKSLILQLDENRRIIGAICAGPTHLALAGILKGIKYTTTRTPEYYTENSELDPFPWENKLNDRVVHDKHIVTSIGVAFHEFADEIFSSLGLYRDENDRKTIIEEFNPKW